MKYEYVISEGEGTLIDQGVVTRAELDLIYNRVARTGQTLLFNAVK